MTFKNETSDRMEICVPVAVQLSVRFWIEPGEELTADAINDAVDQLAYAASDDVFRHPKIDGDYSMSVLGVEPDAMLGFYNSEKEGEIAPPDGVEYAARHPAFVYILTIDHRHGTNSSAHRTREGASAALATFCRDWAHEANTITEGDDPSKMTDDEVISLYFDGIDEFYTIERAELIA